MSCICESGDLLSQWRGYGTDHGYSIELKSDALDHLVSSAVGWTEGTEYPWGGLRQVLYGRDAATQVVTRALDDVRNDTNLGYYGVHAHYMALNLFASLVSVKHPGFEEEREWRLIVAEEQNGPTRSRFRTSSMAIVPYIALPLDLTCIVSITVGPGRYSDARLIGLRRLLESLGVDPRLTVSDVPLRS